LKSLLRVTALATILRGLSRTAQQTLADPEKMQALAGDASRYAAKAQGRGGIVAATLAPIRLMGRMLRAYARRDYREVPWATMGAIAAALLYFVMPFDFVPDILAGFGLVDDLALVAFVMQRVAGDLAEFSAWDMAQRGIVVDGVASVVAEDAQPAETHASDDRNIVESKEAMDAVIAAVVGDKKNKKM